MDDCIFCKIINKDLPSSLVFEDDELIAFNDISPQEKTHILIVPKKHIDTIKDIKPTEQDEILVGKIILAARNIAEEKGITDYRLQFNVGKGAGQTVFHIHLHLLSKQG